MKIKTLTNKLFRAYRIMRANNQWEYHATLLKLDHPKDILISRNNVQLKVLNITLKKDEGVFLMEKYNTLVELQKKLKTKLLEIDDKYYIKIKNLTIELQTAEEIFILKEVFLKGCYNFFLFNQKSNQIIIDIGLNVGIASLFFASHPGVSAVHSFEPFKPTYSQAQRNIQLNPQLKEKINTYEYGLGNSVRSIEVDYSGQHRGRTGIWGTELVLDKDIIMQKEKIKIQPAIDNIEKIIKSYNEDTTFIIKIDCEGAEYEIFENIEIIDYRILNKIKLFMIEWHKKGSKPLELFFQKHNFNIISLNSHDEKVGFIYAFR